MELLKKRVNEFPTPYTLKAAAAQGGPETKLSMLVMGLGNEDLRTFLHENIKKTADDSADGIYLRADDSAADLYDLYGFYKLQQNWQPSGIV